MTVLHLITAYILVASAVMLAYVALMCYSDPTIKRVYGKGSIISLASMVIVLAFLFVGRGQKIEPIAGKPLNHQQLVGDLCKNFLAIEQRKHGLTIKE